MNRKQPEPNTDPLPMIREYIRKQKYRITAHAFKRQAQRSIVLMDVLHVLKHGNHEKEKDEFDVKRQAWKYAIRGKTPDGIELRVIVAFTEESLGIITIIKPIKGR